MNDNRRKLTGILKLLYENTDAEHSMDTYQIMDALESMGYGRPDRKTIDANIRYIIDDLGFGIIKERGKPNKYRWIEREFDITELTMIVDAVHTARFIPPRKSREIIAKLKDLTSGHQAALLNRDLITATLFKRDETYANHSTTVICECIKNHHRMSFQMADYDGNKNEYLIQSGKHFEVSPYIIVWDGDKGHLVGKPADSNEIRSYSILLIRNAVQTQMASEPAPRGFSAEKYSGRQFDMFKGGMTEVQLSCKNSAMKDLVYQFGDNFYSEIESPDRFTARVRVDASPAFYAWVFRSCGDIRIASPVAVKNEYNRMLMDQLKN